MPNSEGRKSGVGNIWTDNPYGGPMFLSAPDSVTGGFGGGAGFSFGGGGSSSAAGGSGYVADAIESVASHGVAGGLSGAQIAKLALTLGIPAVQLARLLGAGGGSSPGGAGTAGLDPALQSRLTDMLDLMNQRVRSTIPVHDAAVRLALSLAPSGQVTPRMTSAIAAAQTPRPHATTDPAVLQAAAALMGRLRG